MFTFYQGASPEELGKSTVRSPSNIFCCVEITHNGDAFAKQREGCVVKCRLPASLY